MWGLTCIKENQYAYIYKICIGYYSKYVTHKNISFIVSQLLYKSNYWFLNFNPILDGLFGGCWQMEEGGDKKASLPKICRTYLTTMKLGTVIPYLKIYDSRDTALEFSWHQTFFHRKSANFAISTNTDIDCILIDNF